MAWLYVPGAPVSNSVSNSCSETGIELWVTVNGKATPRPISWRGWRMRPWIALLSGTISNPSHADSIAAGWILSLPESPASRSRAPGGGTGSPTNAGCGPMFGESAWEWEPVSSSWKKYRSLFPQVCPRPSLILPRRGGLRNGIVFPRAKREHRTDANDCFFWRSPTSSDSQGGAKVMKAQPGINLKLKLKDQIARSWGGMSSTPTSCLRGRRAIRSTMTETSLTPPRSNNGGKSSPQTPRLNPRFTERLMGWPYGWSRYNCAVTELSRWRRRMRSLLSWMLSGKENDR